jgi:excisionase family DNA binding protein
MGDAAGVVNLRTDEERQGDPYQALAEALRLVVEDAVTKALAAAKPQTADDAVMVSVPEAAHRLGIGVTKLKELIGAGRIPSVLVGRRRLLPAAVLEAFPGGLHEPG